MRKYSIGSGKKADFKVDGEGVEKIHAFLVFRNNGSTEIVKRAKEESVYVNDTLLEDDIPVAIEAGQKLKLGDQKTRITLEFVSSKEYKQDFKQKVEQEELSLPEGELIPDNSEDSQEDRLVESVPEKKTKTREEAKPSIESGGWLQNSGLDSEQQKKLFRLMGGKTQEDMELLNQRSSQFDYNRVKEQVEADYSKGIEMRRDKRHMGLGKR